MPVGLAEGLSAGVQGFLQQYDTERDYQNKLTQQAMQKRIEEDRMRRESAAQEAYLLQNNMQMADNGAVSLSPLGIQKKQLEQSQVGHNISRLDPASAESQNAGLLASGLMHQAFPRGEVTLPEGMSAVDLNDENGLLSKAITGGFGMQGRQLTADRIGESNAIRREGLGVRKSDQAAHAADKISNDSRIKTAEQQIDLTERAIGLLGKKGLTNQEFNDVQQEISNAIAGAKSSALGKLERTEYDSISQRLGNLKQMISGQPADAVPDDIKARVVSLAHELNTSLKTNNAKRAESLRRSYNANPEAQQQQDQVIKRYKSDAGLLHDDGLDQLSDEEIQKLYNAKVKGN